MVVECTVAAVHVKRFETQPTRGTTCEQRKSNMSALVRLLDLLRGDGLFLKKQTKKTKYCSVYYCIKMSRKITFWNI